MSENNVMITIGRAYGSGGREIGRIVADKLGIPFYDKELLEEATKKGVLSYESLSSFDEKKASSLFYAMAFNPYTGETTEPLEVLVQNVLRSTILSIAKQGSCVIVGRRADTILRQDFNILSVFISAAIEKRINRVSKRENLSEKESRKKIIKADKSRRAFYNYYGEGDWGEAANYNLCLDSGDLGIDNAADMILHYLKLTGRVDS